MSLLPPVLVELDAVDQPLDQVGPGVPQQAAEPLDRVDESEP
jgi:hypothetical protein